MPDRVTTIACGTKGREDQEKPTANTRPVIDMIIHLAGKRHPVKALLDTGCSVKLINEKPLGK